MPLTTHVVRREELYSVLRSFERIGYSCRSDEDGDWECVKPINELLVDIRYIIVKPD